MVPTFNRRPFYSRAIKKVSKVVNLHWSNNEACSLSQNVYVDIQSYYNEQLSFSNDMKIIFINYFSEFIHKISIKFRFRKALCFQSDIIFRR